MKQLISRWLFRLHIINNHTVEFANSGTALVTIHRTDAVSSNIRPNVEGLKK